MKDALIGAGIGLLASLAFVASGYLIYGWNLGPIQQMEQSEAFGGLIGWPTTIITAVVLLILSTRSIFAFMASVAIIAFVPLSVTIFEAIKFPKSHNLLGLEVIAALIGSALLHLPAFILKGFLALVQAKKNPSANIA